MYNFYNFGVIICQYFNHHCNVDTISCSSHQPPQPKFDRRLNLDLFFCFLYFSLPLMCFNFSFCTTHLFSAKESTWGGHHVFRVWEDTKYVNFILRPPLLSVQTAPPQQFFWRLFTLLIFCHLLQFFFLLLFKWDFHTLRNGKNSPVCLFILPSTDVSKNAFAKIRMYYLTPSWIIHLLSVLTSCT